MFLMILNSLHPVISVKLLTAVKGQTQTFGGSHLLSLYQCVSILPATHSQLSEAAESEQRPQAFSTPTPL